MSEGGLRVGCTSAPASPPDDERPLVQRVGLNKREKERISKFSGKGHKGYLFTRIIDFHTIKSYVHLETGRTNHLYLTP